MKNVIRIYNFVTPDFALNKNLQLCGQYKRFAPINDQFDTKIRPGLDVVSILQLCWIMDNFPQGLELQIYHG